MLEPKVIQALAVTAEMTGTVLTEAGLEAMATHLSAYPVEAVLQALVRCQVELRGHLTLGAVVDRLDDGHLGPEIAWALVAKLREDDTVVWTQEIAEAWGIVRGMLDDRVAARLAFLEAYRAKLGEARTAHRPPRWFVSLGYDAAGRAGPVLEALALGRLSEAAVQRALPPHEWPAPSEGLARRE